jgi:Ca-activated chloride channel family protein
MSAAAFAHPHFAEPRWLWLAFWGPLVAILLFYHAHRGRKKQLDQFASPDLQQYLTSAHSPARRLIKQGLQLAALACFGLALARPQWGETQESGRILGQDILFLLDCSRSMLASDVSPSRLERARLATLDFIQRHGSGRVGLIAFAGEAFLQCPLTYDYGAFQETLNAVDDKTIPVPGTDISAALDEAFRAMDKEERQKIFVLITDGEDLEKNGIRKAGELAKQGVVIFTVGVGTAAGSEIEIINDQGRKEMLTDAKGNIVHSRLDESTLRAIAQATKGAYYRLGPLGEGLAQVRAEIESHNRLTGSAPGQKIGVDRYYYFIALSIILLVADSLLGTRRKRIAEKTTLTPPKSVLNAG